MLQWLGLVSGPVELLYNDAAIMIGLVYTSILFMVVPLVTTLDSLDDSLIEAGYDLGGTTTSILREIVIPHAMPGIVSGCIVVFMLSLGNYLTPILLGGKDSLWFTGMIYNQFITRFNWELGSALGFLLLALSSAIVFFGLKLSKTVTYKHDGARMIPTLPQPRFTKWCYRAYVTVFFIYLALPLSVVCVFAFNNSVFPSPPWEGFTLAWFFGTEAPFIGVFHERSILRAIGTSAFVALWVSGLAVAVGTCNSFLFVRHEFRGKALLYMLMLLPLIIPGVILGISILVFSSAIANTLEDATGLWFDGLRPGLPLVILWAVFFHHHLRHSCHHGPIAKVRP